QYEITLYSDFIANRNVNTLTATRIINVNLTGAPATNEIEFMSAATPPAIGDTVGSVTIRCSSSTPDLTVERRYSVNGGAFTSWATVSGPASAPTTNTTFNITGLPTARELTGQFIPPQYQVDGEVRATLHSGATGYDIDQRGFSYPTNADDVRWHTTQSHRHRAARTGSRPRTCRRVASLCSWGTAGGRLTQRHRRRTARWCSWRTAG